MVFPDQFSFLEGEGFLQVQDLCLVGVENGNGHPLGVEYLLHDEADVHLLPNFLEGVVVGRHPLPRELDAELVKAHVDEVAEVD